MYQRIAAESDEAKRADMLKAVAVSQDLEPRSFVQFLNQMINSPDSSDRWKDYCIKVRQYVIQKYKADNKAQVRPEKPVQAQTGDHEGSSPVNLAKTSDPNPSQEVKEGRSVSSSEQRTSEHNSVEASYDEPEGEDDSYHSTDQGWQEHDDESNKSDLVRKAEPVSDHLEEDSVRIYEPEKLHAVTEDGNPHAPEDDSAKKENYAHDAESSEDSLVDNLTAADDHHSPISEDHSSSEDELSESQKPAQKTGKKTRKKRSSRVLIPEGITVGWILGMMLASALILPWAWLIAKIFWGIASKLLPV